MELRYHLNELGDGRFASGFAAHKPHLAPLIEKLQLHLVYIEREKKANGQALDMSPKLAAVELSVQTRRCQ